MPNLELMMKKGCRPIGTESLPAMGLPSTDRSEKLGHGNFQDLS